MRNIYDGAPFWVTMKEAEIQVIKFYLDEGGGNITNAAILMGMPRAWLYKRLKKLGLGHSAKKYAPRGAKLFTKLDVPGQDTKPSEANAEKSQKTPANHSDPPGTPPDPDAG